MSYRSVTASFVAASRQTKEFRAVLANGRQLERICGESERDARQVADRIAKREKTTVMSLEPRQ